MRVRDADRSVIDAVVTRLVSGKGDIRTPSNSVISYDLDRREAYSYGRHFPLFRFVPRRRRVLVSDEWRTVDSRRPPLFVINGDRWSGSRTRTPDNQADTRAAIAATGVRSIVLPFSALDGAGIDLDSIGVLDARPDREWTETIERRTLAELPLWRRHYTETVTRTARALDRVPARYRTIWRELTNEETASGRYPHAYGTPPYGNAPILPDDNGVYSWREPWKRTVQPDTDGVYRYEETRHRLGDSLFTATRAVTETVPAPPFATETETARHTLRLADDSGRRYCGTSGPHIAGTDGACINCAKPLTAIYTDIVRARYLSSFDYNEPAPLYFLCEVPRAGVPTVDGAIDSLAPRAVHAAILAGSEVRRQGDIFFIDTPLDTATLVARGAVFGRHTLWSRRAKPRKGEITYREPDRAHERTIAARELKYARRLWREEWRAMHERVADIGTPAAGVREANGVAWRTLLERHAHERALADGAGVDHDSPLSMPCASCGAVIGESCRPIPATPDIPDRLHGLVCRGAGRHSVRYAHGRERDTLERETAREPAVPPAPYTRHGSRARWREIRRRHAIEVTAAREALRRATLAGPVMRNGYAAGLGGARYNESATAYRRRAHTDAIRLARGRLDSLVARGARDSNEHTSRRHGRDTYRARFGTNAVALWSRALHAAQLKYRPETVPAANRAQRNRELVRRHLAIYGTAHTATLVARVGTAVYVSGTVRHAVDLDTGRRGAPDHRPIVLTSGRWYLAVRNTVPRQNRRRRRRQPSASGQNGR